MSSCFIILAFSIFFSKFQNNVPMLQMNYELYILHNTSSGHFSSNLVGLKSFNVTSSHLSVFCAAIGKQ